MILSPDEAEDRFECRERGRRRLGIAEFESAQLKKEKRSSSVLRRRPSSHMRLGGAARLHEVTVALPSPPRGAREIGAAAAAASSTASASAAASLPWPPCSCRPRTPPGRRAPQGCHSAVVSLARCWPDEQMQWDRFQFSHHLRCTQCPCEQMLNALATRFSWLVTVPNYDSFT